LTKKTYFIDEVQFFKKGCALPDRVMKVLQKNNEQGIIFPVHLKMTRYFDCQHKIKSSSEIFFSNFDVESRISDSIFTEEFMMKSL